MTRLRTPARRPRTRLAAELLEDRSVPAGFTYTNFTSDAGLTLARSAAVTNNLLRLTPAANGQAGNAWYTAEKQFVGVAFETTVQFRLDKGGGSGYDGFAFVIQNTDPAFAGSGGSTLAYDGLANSLAVEFDTGGDSDLGGQHIAVHSNGRGRNDTDASARIGDARSTSPVVLNDGQVHTARITYTPGTLSVKLDNLSPLNVSVNPADLLGLDEGRAWVGLTAGTTAFGTYQSHDILSWSYQVNANVTTTVSIGDVSQVEGNAGPQTYTFPVYRLGNTAGTTSVNWATADRTASAAGGDYMASSGQVVFGPGETLKTVNVTANGDVTPEGHETFLVQLTNLVGGTIADGMGLGTISNDDVTVTIDDTGVTEGDTRTAFLGAFVSKQSGGLDGPARLASGSDGSLFVVNQSRDGVNRYGPSSGDFAAAFVPQASGGLIRPDVVGFGPDGNLYVCSAFSHEVLRYDGASGAFLGAFVTAGSGGLNNPRGLVFTPDGNLLVSSRGSDQILKYRGPSVGPNGEQPGQFLGEFASPGPGRQPTVLAFGPDGNLYVGLGGPSQIDRYNASTGAFIGTFVPPGTLDGMGQFTFHEGQLYVPNGAFTNDVKRFQGPAGSNPGAFIDSFVPSQLGGLSNPVAMVFGADGNAYVASAFTDEVLRYGAASQAAFTVRLSGPSALPVTVTYVTADGTALSGSDYDATSGTLTFAPGETVKTILVRTLNDAVAEGNETFFVNLTGATGESIADDTGVGAVTDDDVTKFFVADDGSPDRTYRYGTPGTDLGNSALAAGNTAPRGIASTAAGDKVWVADANKTVYVYSAAGALLGSWAAGGLNAQAQVEGVTVWGSDVWLVDNKQDRVFKYAGAASKLSGTLSPASSFNLSSGNGSPKDLVTDGTSLWVVDDGSTDKVFKYTLAGSLLGSWTISGGGGSPTGITLDPTGASQDLWVVDTATDRVYRYAGARSLTSGSATPASTFLLAAGNANPQGIADPPPAAAEEAWVAGPAVAPLGLNGPAAPAPAIVPVSATIRPLPTVAPGGEPAMAQSAPLSGWPPRLPRLAADWSAVADLDLTPVVVDRPAGRRLR